MGFACITWVQPAPVEPELKESRCSEEHEATLKDMISSLFTGLPEA